MKRILVSGLKQPMGGVESVVKALIEKFDENVLQVDFAVYGAADALADIVTARGGKVWQLPSRFRHPFAHARAVREMFLQTRYDAVWCHVSGLTNLQILRAAEAADVKKRVVHAHTADYAWGTPLMRYIVPLLHRKNRRIVHRYATHLWTCSDRAAAFMYGTHPCMTVQIVPNAIDVQRFAFSPSARQAARETFGLQDAPTVLHVGRMCTAKNQKFVLDIFAATLRKNPQARLLFVGDGELREEITAYAKTCGVEQAVVFTGALSDAVSALQAGDVFLLPSLTEGFPVTVMEAQANGLPCVVSKEAVTQEVNVSGNVHFISLQEGTATWATAVSDCFDGRFDVGTALRDAGYDSVDVALRVQQFFCEGVEI